MIILCFMIVLLVGGCFCRLFENHQKKSHLNFIAKNAAAFVQVLLNCVKNWQTSQSCKVRLFFTFSTTVDRFFYSARVVRRKLPAGFSCRGQ